MKAYNVRAIVGEVTCSNSIRGGNSACYLLSAAMLVSPVHVGRIMELTSRDVCRIVECS